MKMNQHRPNWLELLAPSPEAERLARAATDARGLVLAQPAPKLCSRHKLFLPYGLIDAIKGKPSRVIFSNARRYLPRRAIIGRAHARRYGLMRFKAKRGEDCNQPRGSPSFGASCGYSRSGSSRPFSRAERLDASRLPSELELRLKKLQLQFSARP